MEEVDEVPEEPPRKIQKESRCRRKLTDGGLRVRLALLSWAKIRRLGESRFVPHFPTASTFPNQENEE